MKIKEPYDKVRDFVLRNIENKSPCKREVKVVIGKDVRKTEDKDEYILHGQYEAKLKEDTIVHKIILNKDSIEINDTIIHEIIHASLNDIYLDEHLIKKDSGKNLSLIKLAKKIDRNEEMVDILSRNISRNIKLMIKKTSKIVQ